jgi:hypothetical protein
MEDRYRRIWLERSQLVETLSAKSIRAGGRPSVRSDEPNSRLSHVSDARHAST